MRYFLLSSAFLLFPASESARAMDWTKSPTRESDMVQDHRLEGKSPYQTGIINLAQGLNGLRFIAPKVNADVNSGRCNAASRIRDPYNELQRGMKDRDPFRDLPQESTLTLDETQLAKGAGTAGIDCTAFAALDKILAADDAKLTDAEGQLAEKYGLVPKRGKPIATDLSSRPYGDCSLDEIAKSSFATPPPTSCQIEGKQLPVYNCLAVHGVDLLVKGYDEVSAAIAEKRKFLQDSRQKLREQNSDKNGKPRCP